MLPTTRRISGALPRRTTPRHSGSTARAAGEDLVEHCAEGPNVGALVDWASASLLGSHVGRGTEDGSSFGGPQRHSRRIARSGTAGNGLIERLRQAEVQHFDDAFGSDLEVGGLQIAM